MADERFEPAVVSRRSNYDVRLNRPFIGKHNVAWSERLDGRHRRDTSDPELLD